MDKTKMTPSALTGELDKIAAAAKVEALLNGDYDHLYDENGLDRNGYSKEAAIMIWSLMLEESSGPLTDEEQDELLGI